MYIPVEKTHAITRKETTKLSASQQCTHMHHTPKLISIFNQQNQNDHLYNLFTCFVYIPTYLYFSVDCIACKYEHLQSHILRKQLFLNC